MVCLGRILRGCVSPVVGLVVEGLGLAWKMVSLVGVGYSFFCAPVTPFNPLFCGLARLSTVQINHERY